MIKGKNNHTIVVNVLRLTDFGKDILNYSIPLTYTQTIGTNTITFPYMVTHDILITSPNRVTHDHP